MKLIILNNSDDVCEWCANYVIKRIRDFKPTKDRKFVLGLPTGGTPEVKYSHLY